MQVDLGIDHIREDLPSVYGNGITLSREMPLAYNFTLGQSTIKGQRRAGPGSMGGGSMSGTWGTWLDKNWPVEGVDDYGTKDGDTWLFDETGAEYLYNWMINNWTSVMGDKPTKEDFYEWLRTNGGKYQMMPIGDIIPLCLIALAYMAMVFIRKRKLAK